MRFIKLYAITLGEDTILSDMWDNITYRVEHSGPYEDCIGFASKDPSSKRVEVLVPASSALGLHLESNPEEIQYITDIFESKILLSTSSRENSIRLFTETE